MRTRNAITYSRVDKLLPGDMLMLWPKFSLLLGVSLPFTYAFAPDFYIETYELSQDEGFMQREFRVDIIVLVLR